MLCAKAQCFSIEKILLCSISRHITSDQRSIHGNTMWALVWQNCFYVQVTWLLPDCSMLGGSESDIQSHLPARCAQFIIIDLSLHNFITANDHSRFRPDTPASVTVFAFSTLFKLTQSRCMAVWQNIFKKSWHQSRAKILSTLWKLPEVGMVFKHHRETMVSASFWPMCCLSWVIFKFLSLLAYKSGSSSHWHWSHVTGCRSE